ncbi:O-antigen ligase family protein [Aureivirga sp. CE67]|uniref:O-antigen ligase family protein n=1 Tax=Aureivirga sp. CE67 TaxID=1788983 RepID=UPI0018CAEF69|nr:O-antigen ligase family protein [Aureivirga sp. CE67]
MKNLICKLGLFFIFFDNMYLPFDIGFDFKLIYIFMLLFIVYATSIIGRVNIKKEDLQILTFVLFFLMINLFVNISGIVLFMKQFIGISIAFIYSFLFIAVYKFDFKKIIEDYILVIKIAIIGGLLQFIFAKLGKHYLVDFSVLGFDLGNNEYKKYPFRVHSWFQEPSFLVYAITPILLIVITRFFGLHRKVSFFISVLTIFVVFLSMSSIGFISILLSVGLFLISKYSFVKKPIFLVSISIAVIIVSLFVYNLPKVKTRVDDTINILTSDQITTEQIDDLNFSSYALFSNFKVAMASFKEDPIFGCGLGNYELRYDELIDEVLPPNKFIKYKIWLNRGEANSFFFRFLTETGLIGILFYFWFLYHYRIRFPKNYQDNKELILLWCFNNGLFILFILRLLRNGHYIHLGIEFMWIMYYLTSLQYKIKRREYQEKLSINT